MTATTETRRSTRTRRSTKVEAPTVEVPTTGSTVDINDVRRQLEAAGFLVKSPEPTEFRGVTLTDEESQAVLLGLGHVLKSLTMTKDARSRLERLALRVMNGALLLRVE